MIVSVNSAAGGRIPWVCKRVQREGYDAHPSHRVPKDGRVGPQ